MRRRIFSTFGERDQTARLARRGAIGTFPNPVLPFAFGEGIEIEDGRPRRHRGRVIGKRRRAPDTANVFGILPKIKDAATDKFGARYTIRCLVDLEGVREKSRKVRIAFECAERFGILGLRPFERARAIEFFEIEKRVRFRRGRGDRRGRDGRCCDGGHRPQAHEGRARDERGNKNTHRFNEFDRHALFPFEFGCRCPKVAAKSARQTAV